MESYRIVHACMHGMRSSFDNILGKFRGHSLHGEDNVVVKAM